MWLCRRNTLSPKSTIPQEINNAFFKASQDHLISHVLPMLVRAYDDTDPRFQEEVLKKTVALAKQLDLQNRGNFIRPLLRLLGHAMRAYQLSSPTLHWVMDFSTIILSNLSTCPVPLLIVRHAQLPKNQIRSIEDHVDTFFLSSLNQILAVYEPGSLECRSHDPFPIEGAARSFSFSVSNPDFSLLSVRTGFLRISIIYSSLLQSIVMDVVSSLLAVYFCDPALAEDMLRN
ncbi:hypothetical protein HAX54_011753 [Datura stramonium]|uniref:Uncharacterized protein n=1 Tax=Datura stramonium TaxID=4076 RepID=A0ABS8TKH7_DATST|nr:hypothetical protein [Datura stramonium]